MVRKVTTLICVLAVVLCFSIPTQAASVDFDTAFRVDVTTGYLPLDLDEEKIQPLIGYINKLPFGHDYILYSVHEENLIEYVLVTANDFDVVESDSMYHTITSEHANIYLVVSERDGYQWNTHFESEEDMTYLLDTDLGCVYSSIDRYPDIVERSYYAETLNTILLVVLLLSFVLSAFFRSR